MPASRSKKPKKSARARNRGQVIARGDRKWLVRFYVGTDARTGKRRYGSAMVAGTFSQAERELIKKLAEVASGVFRAPVRQTLTAYLNDEWLAERSADVKAGTLSGRSLADYRRSVEKLVTLSGALQLDAIGKADVALLKRQLIERYQPSAAQRAFDVFRMSMKRAFEVDRIAVNPAPLRSG